jgi:two-component system, chemotaxis family, chemotaxis protein CheY
MSTTYNFGQLNALIVDDYSPMHEIMRGILKEFGIARIAEANSGAEAIKELEFFHADVIFTDYMMEDMNGLELIREIRAGNTSANRFTPIVVVSAYTEVREILAARDIGATEFLAKPISGTLVYYRLRSVVENPREFVEAESYFGPDRRRRELAQLEANRREIEYEYKKSQRETLRPT